jgi:hypothetical protein
MTLHTPPARPRRLRLIRKLLCATFLVALFAVIVSPLATAQTAQYERHRDSRPQAVLHIEARVVAVAFTPSPRASNSPTDNAGASGVIYSLPARESNMTVFEETRPLFRADVRAWFGSGTLQTAVLKTLTVVPQ